MSNKGHQNKFFLISFLPAVAYWYLESHYNLRIALIGGLGLAILEMVLEKILFKHIHQIAKLNFAIIAFLGGISLLGDDGIWFKLQPFFGSLFMGSFILYKNRKTEDGLLYSMMKEMNSETMPRDVIHSLEFHFVFFLYFHAIFMGTLAVWWDTDTWLFWKTIGFYILFAVFFLLELPFIRAKLKKAMAEVVVNTSINSKQL